MGAVVRAVQERAIERRQGEYYSPQSERLLAASVTTGRPKCS